MDSTHSHNVSLVNPFSQWKNTILDIKELMAVLKYRDLRSVLKWCKDHNVFVLNHGNAQVVNQVEFLLAFYKPFMRHLKGSNENWREVFVDYILGNVKNLIRDEVKEKTLSSYSPRSAVEKSFLDKIKDL